MTAVWSWSGQQPAWVTAVEGMPGDVLTFAWLTATGAVDDESGEALVRSTVAWQERMGFDLARLVELVRDAERFDDEPHAAVDDWNTRCRDVVQYDEAEAMRDQLRADALAVAEQIHAAGTA